MQERQTIRTIKDCIAGEFQAPGFPLRFSAFPQMVELEAPFLGEHNQEILRDYLGYSAQQGKELAARKLLRQTNS